MADKSGLYDYEKELKNKKVKNKKTKKQKANKKPSNQYKADNEIIIGVTVTNQPKADDKNKKKKINEKKKAKIKEKNSVNKKRISKETLNNDYDKKINKKQKQVKKIPIKINKNENKINLETENDIGIDYISKDVYEEVSEEKKSKVNKFLKWTSIFAVIIGVTIFAMVSPIFNIKKIDVVGNSKVETEKIIGLSGVETGNNIFRISKLQVSNKIKKNGFVEDVKITRKLPDTIEISVIERVPGFQIKFGNGYVVINNQGYIIEIVEESREDIPFLEGMTTPEDKYIENNRLDEDDLYKLNTVLKIVTTAASNGIDSLITSIDMSDVNNVKLYFEDDEKTAYIGDCSNIETRILWVKQIMEKEEDNAGEIMVNMNLNTDDPYFRRSID